MSVCRSAAWDAKVITSAWWVYASQVSKTAPTGEYLTTGSFMIRGKKNFLPPNKLEMGFGIMFKIDESSIPSHIQHREALRLAESAEPLDGSQADDKLEDQEITMDSDDERDNKSEISIESEKSTSTQKRSETTNFGTTNKVEVQTVGGEKLRVRLISDEDAADMAKGIGSDEDGTSDKESAVSEATGDNKQKRYRTAKEKREEKKRKKSPGITTEQTPENITQKQEKTQAEEIIVTVDKNEDDESDEDGDKKKSRVPLPRGKRSKMRKIKEKYKDQDEEERNLKMQILASSGKSKKEKEKEIEKEKEKEKAKIVPVPYKKPQPKAKEIENIEEIQVENDTQEVIITEQETGADLEEKKKIMEEENIIELNEDDKEKLNELDSVVGIPLPDDILQFAVVVCGPYTALNSFKFKVKLTPGSMKRGKAAKAAISFFLHHNELSQIERDLIKFIEDNEMVHSILGNVKLSSPGLQLTKSNQKAKKKKQHKEKDTEIAE